MDAAHRICRATPCALRRHTAVDRVTVMVIHWAVSGHVLDLQDLEGLASHGELWSLEGVLSPVSLGPAGDCPCKD